ncbi:Hypothetical protein R9X50_00393500 [Acrodontium crateriforme]|uniref:Mso1 N-terminal domain-containing protein n=1 Tax=Acrodontium crateriforme TaxID=150365 RepID=A0AAQ3M567_9PEZI|nr:Hypothetical protein R9X50_00393500 [Acrodontium crateriforme]
MSSYLSNLLTHTTSRYNSLRRTLLSNEDDGDTEDDSHISRVLRAYYVEKGRPFPPWLPPDPNDRRNLPLQQQQPYGQAPGGYYTSAGGRSQLGNVQQQNAVGSRSSLSDLWDPQPVAAPAPTQPTSLRSARRPGGTPSNGPGAPNTLAPPQARPLPSQRVGSYQSVNSQQRYSAAEPSPPGSSSGLPGGGTAQDRLKARLWGGRNSPVPSSTSLNQPPAANQYDQPPSRGGMTGSNSSWSNGGGNQYDAQGRGGGGYTRR